jgi:hypothetical protein
MAGPLESKRKPERVEAYAAKCCGWRVRGVRQVTGGLRMVGLATSGMWPLVLKLRRKKEHCIESIVTCGVMDGLSRECMTDCIKAKDATSFPNPTHGSGWIVQVQPTRISEPSRFPNPTHGSGWIVQVQPTRSAANVSKTTN